MEDRFGGVEIIYDDDDHIQWASEDSVTYATNNLRREDTFVNVRRGEIYYLRDNYFKEPSTKHYETDALEATVRKEYGLSGDRLAETVSLARALFEDASLEHPRLLPLLREAVRSGDSWVGRVRSFAPDRQINPEHNPAQTVTARWKDDRLEGDTPLDFIKRHYGAWMKSDMTGITISDIGKIDPPLREKLRNYMRRHDLPDDFHLPTREQKNAALLEQIKAGAPMPEDHRAYMRLARAAHNRGTSLRPQR